MSGYHGPISFDDKESSQRLQMTVRKDSNAGPLKLYAWERQDGSGTLQGHCFEGPEPESGTRNGSVNGLYRIMPSFECSFNNELI
jgi:hypothetical protein